MNEPKRNTLNLVTGSAESERDETRRWLLEIGTAIGILPSSADRDHSQHQAWESYKDEIIEFISEQNAQAES